MERLVAKFLDGETSLQEERRLYDYFAQSSLPRQLEQYRLLFAGFAAIGKPQERRHATHIHLWRIVAGMAAAVLIVLGRWQISNLHEEWALARIYSGSYVIDNGHRIDDLRQIETDIKTTLTQADHIERQAESNSVVEQAERNIINNIDDPQMRKEVMDMLN